MPGLPLEPDSRDRDELGIDQGELPLKSKYELPALLALTLVARLPFLAPGYGTDPDAWRVGLAARVMKETGRFASSRVPGHPVQELSAWALQPFGSLGINLVTALLSVLSVALFHRVARRLELPHAFALSLGFAFLPVFFVHSVDAMDYVWALAFLLGAVELTLSGRPWLAGACVGLAVGCRLTSFAFLVALLPLAPRRDLLKTTAAAIVVGALCYLPVLMTYGLGYLRFTPTQYPRLLYVAKAFTIDLFGLVGCVGLAVALLARWRLRAGDRWRSVRLAFLALLAVSVAMFLRLPDDAAYLLPVIPFFLWTLATILPPRRVAVLAVALALSGFVLRLREVRPEVAPVRELPAVKIDDRLALDLAGPILVDHARRVAQDAYADSLLARLPRDATLLAGEWYPILNVKGGGSRIVGYPEPAQLDLLATRPLYYVPGSENDIRTRTSLDVRQWGAKPL